MQSIIQTCIALEGGSVSIAARPADDKAIKDAINELCLDIDRLALCIEKLETLLEEIGGSDSEKEAMYSRLAFLFGQLAKQGVLGYHHGFNNTANDLFYKLSAKCFAKLSRSPTLPERDQKNLEKILADLAAGVCIEATTNNFLIEYPDVDKIWHPR